MEKVIVQNTTSAPLGEYLFNIYNNAVLSLDTANEKAPIPDFLKTPTVIETQALRLISMTMQIKMDSGLIVFGAGLSDFVDNLLSAVQNGEVISGTATQVKNKFIKSLPTIIVGMVDQMPVEYRSGTYEGSIFLPESYDVGYRKITGRKTTFFSDGDEAALINETPFQKTVIACKFTGLKIGVPYTLSFPTATPAYDWNLTLVGIEEETLATKSWTLTETNPDVTLIATAKTGIVTLTNAGSTGSLNLVGVPQITSVIIP